MSKKTGKGKLVLLVVGLIAAFSLVNAIVSKKSSNIIPSASASIQFSDSDDDEAGTSFFGRFFSFDEEEDSFEKKPSKPYVSVIYISGVISPENKTYNQKWLLRQIKKAQKDEKNTGILLVIDSPGGTVYESDEAYLALLQYKSVAKRPVYAYFGSLAASGGYYISCAADKIFANRNTLTGSIGVIAGQSVDATGLMEKLGIKMTTITAGKNKNMGNYNSVLTEEQKAIMQSIADEAYDQFTGIVAESRNMSIEEVRKLADGRIYTAAQAKKNGLIDEVCSIEAARESISKDLEKKVEFPDFKYKYEEKLIDLIYGAAGFIENPTATAYSLLSAGSGKCMYLYQ